MLFETANAREAAVRWHRSLWRLACVHVLVGCAFLVFHVAGPAISGLASVAHAQTPQALRQVSETVDRLSRERVAIWRSLLQRPSRPSEPSALEQAKRELGARLFHDTRLSGPNDRACASCHQPDRGFSDGRVRAAGRDATATLRNTPSLWDIGWAERFNWDGRARSLQAQALGPILSPHEMAGDFDQIVRRLRGDDGMRALFKRAFADRQAPHVGPIQRDTILEALAAYTASIRSPQTRFDAWAAGDDGALTGDALLGLAVFVGRGQCATCHRGWRFTDDGLHDIGLPLRGDETRVQFKTPTLRGLTLTAPYMHDGRFDTLRAAVRHYSHGVVDRPSLSPNLALDLDLSDRDIAALVAFLKSLSPATASGSAN